VRGMVVLVGCAAMAALASGCGGAATGQANVVHGKEQFVAKCGVCHTLARAGTKGTAGPNLDEAFQRASRDGFGETTFAGIVAQQILQPSRLTQVDPKTGKEVPGMPANLLEGRDVGDVAAYVSMTAGAGGKDSGQLASVGARPEGTAKEEGGTLSIPVHPNGGLAYQFADAEATAGPVKIVSKNGESIDHNIAVEGAGIDEKGPVVSNGATSEVDIDLEPGEYTFYCSVDGHRQGGMEGKLTVK
jgi:plastocyanin